MECFWSKLKLSSLCLTDSKVIAPIYEMRMPITDNPVNRVDNSKVERAARLNLARMGFPQLKSVECLFHDGMMFLSGKVPSYHQKQLAQQALRDIRHISLIVNNLEVST